MAVQNDSSIYSLFRERELYSNQKCADRPNQGLCIFLGDLSPFWLSDMLQDSVRANRIQGLIVPTNWPCVICAFNTCKLCMLFSCFLK